MTVSYSLSDYQELARAVTDLVPSDVPLTPTLESVAPDLSALSSEFELATVHYVGACDARLLLAVTGQTMAPLGQSGLDLGSSRGPQVLLDSVAHKLGQGVIVSQRVALEAFNSASTVYFSLRAGVTLHGWFALNIQEVAPMFDQSSSGAVSESDAGLRTRATGPATADPKSMRMLYDVEMTLTAEIGRAKLPVRQILDLTPGVIVELDRVAGSAADLMVNGHLVARGEVVVVDEDYGLRITEIMDATEGLV
ncbi:flagellar motor switch protein FliN [Jonesiaceae bacterium BS-20]|uniref:Flagellar motor switch protein FliN n=1 Tax=Jonesiaceae bacterium BS-20 TaxID=3120821 RepID=A0AAU7DVD3_9MICO